MDAHAWEPMFDPGGHPDAVTVAAVALDAFGPAVTARIVAHVCSCTSCRDRGQALAATSRDLATTSRDLSTAPTSGMPPAVFDRLRTHLHPADPGTAADGD